MMTGLSPPERQLVMLQEKIDAELNLLTALNVPLPERHLQINDLVVGADGEAYPITGVWWSTEPAIIYQLSNGECVRAGNAAGLPGASPTAKSPAHGLLLGSVFFADATAWYALRLGETSVWGVGVTHNLYVDIPFAVVVPDPTRARLHTYGDLLRRIMQVAIR